MKSSVAGATTSTSKLEEVTGDYSISAARSVEAPGNIRAGFTIRGNRGSLSADAEDQEYKNSQKLEKMPKAVVAYLVKDGKVLAVSRFEDDYDLNMPGGSVEPGEDPREAAVRELWEETGIKASQLYPVFTKVNKGVLVTAYKVTAYSGKLKSSWEGKPSWEDPEVILQSTFGSYFREMLRSLQGKSNSKT